MRVWEKKNSIIVPMVANSTTIIRIFHFKGSFRKNRSMRKGMSMRLPHAWGVMPPYSMRSAISAPS